MSQPTFHSIADDGIADLLRDHEANLHLPAWCAGSARPVGMHHHGLTPGAHPASNRLVELIRRTHPQRSGQHGSGRQLGAALAAAGRQNGPPSPGAHPGAEAMGTRTPTIARLERALAQGKSPSFVWCMLRSKQIWGRRACSADNGSPILRHRLGDRQKGPTPRRGVKSSRHAEPVSNASGSACVSPPK